MFNLSTKARNSTSNAYSNVICGLTTSTFVALSSTGGGDLYYSVGTIDANGAITYGTRTLAKAGASYSRISKLDNTHVLVVYQDYPEIYAMAGTVSGTTITFGTPVLVYSSLQVEDFDVDCQDSTYFTVIYDTADTDILKMTIGSVSGNTVTMSGSITTVSSNNCQRPSIIFLDSSRFIIEYEDDDDNKIYFQTGTVSGTTITLGDDTSTSNTDKVLAYGKSLSKLTATTAICTYRDSSGPTLKAAVLTYSAPTLSVGSFYTVDSVDVDGSSGAAYSVTYIDSTYIYFIYADDTNSKLKAKAGKVAGTAISLSSAQTLLENAADYVDIGIMSSSAIVAIYSNTGGDDDAYCLTDIFPVSASVSTSACSAVTNTTLTGNGTINNVGYASCTVRGFCYKVYDGTDPTTSDSKVYDSGTFSSGAYTKGVTGLTANTQYSFRAYATNSEGTSYGTRVDQYTNGVTNPSYAYADDANYMTCHSVTNGNMKIKLSKDGGSNWSNELTETAVAGEATYEYGDGDTELWGLSWIGSEVNSATNFRLRITFDNDVQSRWTYYGFGFTLGASDIVTGLKVECKAKWDGSVISVNHLKITAYYGTSTIPISAGAVAFATNGRKTGEGAGAGTGLMVYYDGSNWIRPADDSTVAA